MIKLYNVEKRISGEAEAIGIPLVQPLEVEILLQPDMNLSYSNGKIRIKYKFTELSGFEQTLSLTSAISSPSASQLGAVGIKNKNIFSIFVEDNRLFLIARNTRELPALSSWQMKCEAQK